MPTATKILPLVIILFLCLLAGSSGLNCTTDYCGTPSVTQGNTEYINDTLAYISATPKSLTGSGEVYIDFMSKVYTTNVTAAFCFNKDYTRPTALYRFNPHNDTIQESYTCGYTVNITQGTYFICQHIDNGTRIIEFEKNVSTFNLTNKTAFWNTSVFTNWTKITADFKKININYDNKDTCFILENVSVTAGTLMKTKVVLDAPTRGIKKNLEKAFPGFSPKYGIAFYPSSYGNNYQQAIADDKFFYLDPTVSINNALISDYEFENNAIDENNKMNGTNGGGSYGTTNPHNGSYSWNTTATSNNFTVNRATGEDLYNFKNGNFTIAFWFRTSNTGAGYLFQRRGSAHGMIYMHSTGDFSIYGGGTSCNPFPTGINIGSGVWTHLMMVRNSTHYTSFVNGKQNVSVACTLTLDFDAGSTVTGLGAPFGGSNNALANVAFDRFQSFNRSLNSTGIDNETSQLYNEGAGYLLPVSDIVNLTVHQPTTSSPRNVSSGQTLSINFTLYRGTYNYTNTTSLNVTNVLIGGSTCPVNTHSSTCSGTANSCESGNNNNTQSTCEAAGCTYTTGSSLTTKNNFTSTNNALSIGGWTTPNNANANDGNNAVGNLNNQTRYGGFNFTIPQGTTITSICVMFESAASTNTGTNTVTIQAWNGSAWGTTNISGDIQTTVVNTTMCGLWGLTWTNTTANNISFNFSATTSAAGRTINMDFITANITYSFPSNCTGTPTSCNDLAADYNQCLASGCSGAPAGQDLYCFNGAICQVNCTLPSFSNGLKDLYMEVNNTGDNSYANTTQTNCVDYGTGGACTCPASGNWVVSGSDNCVITSSCNLQRNNLTCTGSGSFIVDGAVIGNITYRSFSNSCVRIARNNGRYG